MTLALAFFLLLLTVPLFGGRLSRLETVRLRWLWLAFLAFGVQVVLVTVVPEGDTGLHRGLHLATYVLVGACVVRNLDLRFLWVAALGGLLNFVAIVANGGVMPASRGALCGRRASMSGRVRSRTRMLWTTHVLLSSATSSPSPPAGRARTCSAWETW